MASRSKRQRTKTKHYTDDDPATFTTKEKRGETPPPAPSPAKKRPRPVKRSHRRMPPPPQHVSLSHHVRMSPLFDAPDPQHSVIFGRGLGIPPHLKKPEWEEMPPPVCYFPQVTEEPTTPMFESTTASCSCLASDDQYLAMGDTAGFVSIYTLQPKLLSVARLDTTASARERSSNLKLPPSKKFRAYEKKSHPNQIDYIALSGNRLVLSTKHEVELVDVRENSILWSFPLEIPCQSLDIHMSTHQVLCSFVPDTKNDAISPLWLLDGVQAEGGKFEGKKVLVRPTNDDTTLSLGHRCAAVWDKSNVSHLLMVTMVLREDGSTKQDLLKLDKTKFKVVQRTTVPNKPSGKSSCHTVEYLSQSPSGHLTLVSSTKGIRMLETSSLKLLRVFGDSVALHGHSLTFQQCLFIPKPTLPNQMDDLLEERQKRIPIKDEDWTTLNSAWVMGVPFANREPRELRDTLHVWKLWDGKHTSSTVLAPSKSEGFHSVEFVHNKLIVATQTGSCFTKAPTIQSDFPGIMYPAGYQVINDNLEYIEDEDDVDAVTPADQIDEEHDGVDNYQMARAVRLSMMEQHQVTEEVKEVIDVVGDDEGNQVVLPCHPEPFLKQSFHDGSSPMSVDSHDCIQPKSFASSLLLPMPHFDNAAEARQSHPIADEPKPVVFKPIRAKRSKAASLETLLKSSLDPHLRRVMMARQLCAKGSGSRHDHYEKSNTVEATDGSDAVVSKELLNGSNGRATDQSIVLFSEKFSVLSSSERSVPSSDKTADVDSGATAENEAVCTNGADLHTLEIITESTYAESDAAAALLMSASGELDSPPPAENLEGTEPVELKADHPISHRNSHVDPVQRKKVPAMVDTQAKCFACRGRCVFHRCGKKDKPVDYDELLKAEEEKREEEEEEKRKARAEKRRIADAKRREARKKKKLEDDARFQREEIERIRWEKEHRQQQLDRSRLHSDDKDRRRVDMLQRLQAEQTTIASAPSEWPPPVQSYGKLQAPSTYQSYSTPHSSWLPPQQSYDTSQDEPRHPSPYAADWPAPANHTPVQTTDQTQNLYSPQGGAWSQPSQVPQNQTIAMTADSQYRGASGWPEAIVSGTSYHSEPREQASSTDTAATQVENEQLPNSTAGQRQYSSSHYMQVPATTSAAIAQPLTTYATQAAPKTNFDTIDPAEALASLAMFAIAAPKVTVDEDYHNQSVYRGGPSEQYSQQHEAVQMSHKEERPQQSQEYQINGWSNSDAHPHQGDK